VFDAYRREEDGICEGVGEVVFCGVLVGGPVWGVGGKSESEVDAQRFERFDIFIYVQVRVFI